MNGILGLRALTRGAILRRVSFLLLVLLLGAGGCDEFANVTGNETVTTIEGTWETTDGPLTIYLQVTSSTVTIYEGETDGCFIIDLYNISAQDGDTYTLASATDATETMSVSLRIENGMLRVESLETGDDFNKLFNESTANLSALEECTILGTWKSTTDGYVEYLDITSNTLTYYAGYPSDCFDIYAYDIVAQTDDVFTLRDASGSQFDILVEVEGQQLRVASPEDPNNNPWYLDRTGDDLSSLEECTSGSGDCSALPAISVGESINGELTTSDASDGGYYYDLYGLTLGSEQQVQIDYTSTEIDNYLYLYEADGTYITEDDDGGPDSLDSRIVITLQAGCYIIEATSFSSGETGSYTLSVQ